VPKGWHKKKNAVYERESEREREREKEREDRGIWDEGRDMYAENERQITGKKKKNKK
jgi:hypothetical protein